ncbi:MAG TPA: DUF1499 domain-containing protein [Burkholderiales bacterium]|jgi:uncharacterized protein (DUF1499 family)|nr:DUF1499 domain-containing protein [Burkholderiales bacterium]
MIGRTGLGLALLALAVLAASGPAVRLGLVSYGVGILMLLAAGALGLAGALFGAVALFRRAGVARSLFAVVLGASVAAIPAAAYLRARSVPPINDISTDPNESSDAQRRAYPDIRPSHLAVAPYIAFERAKGAMEESGWQIVREDPSAGRIEAVATTFWFGFKDDVVVRITADGAGSRVDVRSKSRVGRGDLGTNAQRIRAYQRRLQ